MTTRSPPCTNPSRIGATYGPEEIFVAPADLPSETAIMARAASENFRVASRVLPRAVREHLLAFYGYARLVDELGDAYPGDRLAALDWIESETRQALSRPGTDVHPLVARAVTSVCQLDADPAPLFALVAANRQDQAITTYETFADLMGYCRLSANPVGRLVLEAFGTSDPTRQMWSDSICSGLQLAEHWQDITEDAAAGRVYLPLEDRRRFGVTVADLTGAGPARPGLRALVAFEVVRARRLLDEGAPLMGSLRGRLRWAIAGFWAGGHAALDAVAARGYDPLGAAPHARASRVLTNLVAALTGAAPLKEAA